MIKYLPIVFFLLIGSLHLGAQKQPSDNTRLVITEAEFESLKCEIVSLYFDFKKYVQTITNRNEIFRIRKANEIALERLLDPNFTTTDFIGGNKRLFIESLSDGTKDFSLLDKRYESFDCPSYINLEVKKITNVGLDGKEIKTTYYDGILLFSQTDITSFTMSDVNGNGIQQREKIRQLYFRIYKLNEEDISLNILKIKADKTVKIVEIDSVGGREIKKDFWVKPKPKNFVECCDQPQPKDSDNDGYNDLVDCEPYNSQIHPGAIDIPGDDIDQNCDGKLNMGKDADGDGYTSEACKSTIPEIRLLCDCNDDDPDIYYRDTLVDNRIIPNNGWNDDNCDCVKDQIEEFQWNYVSVPDYLFVGKGHLIRGPKSKFSRRSTAVLYAGSFLASTGFSIYSKVRSNRAYNLHLDAKTLRTTDSFYDDANKHHKRFLVSAGLASLIYITQASHLRIKDVKQERFYRETIEGRKNKKIDSEDICIRLYPYSVGNEIGLSLTMNF